MYLIHQSFLGDADRPALNGTQPASNAKPGDITNTSSGVTIFRQVVLLILTIVVGLMPYKCHKAINKNSTLLCLLRILPEFQQWGRYLNDDIDFIRQIFTCRYAFLNHIIPIFWLLIVPDYKG